jgi:alanyl-tRNA synthetase
MTTKLYWENSYETKFKAKIVSIKEKGIELDQTLFYPESGNQLSDKGYLKVNDNLIRIEQVTKEEGKILHHIASDSIKNLNVGDRVEGEIDWEYRYGLMKTHTSQHVLSAVLKEKYNIDTLRATLNFEEAIIQLSKDINYDQLKEVLIYVNQIFTKNNLTLTSRIMSRKDAEKFTKKIRSEIPNESEIRLIEIENLDLVCCGGTHVQNTSEIGEIFIYDLKKGNEIKYFVGNKALSNKVDIDIDILNLSNDLKIPFNNLKKEVINRLNFITLLEDQQKELSIKYLESIANSPIKIVNQISLFFVDFDIDIKILGKSFDFFPVNSVIIVRMESNKVRLFSLNNEINANHILEKLINEYGGKGGGNPKSAQAYLEKMPENLISKIESLLFEDI